MELHIRKRRLDLTFIQFVDKMISSKNILSVSLSLFREYDSCVPVWIKCISKLKLERFKLFYAHERLLLDFTDFNSCSLKRLELVFLGQLGVPSMTFPHLTYLYLDGLEVFNSSGNEKLELDFPNLRKFKIRACLWRTIKTVEIRAPALTTFKHESSDQANENYCSIRIIGANLVKFESSGGLAENCILAESTVVSASLLKYTKLDDEQLYKEFGYKVRELVMGFTGLKHLTISGCLSKGLALSSGIPYDNVYDKLERLVLYSPGYSEALLELLNAAPSLKSLVIDRVKVDRYRNDYATVESVPSCLLFNLEEIKLNYLSCTRFHVEKFQFHVEKFLLENGRKLKRVHVSVHDCMQKEEIMKKLSAFSTCSTSLTFFAT